MQEFAQRLFDHGVHVMTMELSRYLIAATAISLLLIGLRRWTEPRRIQARKASFADRRREFGHSARTLLIFGLNGIIILLLRDAGWISLDEHLPPLWLFLGELVLVMVAHDAWFYWMHRSLHSRLMFRRAHATHHGSRTPTPWAAYSFAPVEGFFEAVYLPLLLIALPLHGVTILAFLVHQIIRNVIGHCGHELAWPGFTRSRWTGWLTTTTHHDLHHQEGRYNFGLYFTWWDRLMATEHPDYHARFDAVAAPIGRTLPEHGPLSRTQ